MIEKVQRHFTKTIFGMKNLTYEPETPHFHYIAIFRYRREVTSETSAFVCQAVRPVFSAFYSISRSVLGQDFSYLPAATSACLPF